MSLELAGLIMMAPAMIFGTIVAWNMLLYGVKFATTKMQCTIEIREPWGFIATSIMIILAITGYVFLIFS